MNSKERVLTTFARQEADRIPINYSSNSGIDRRLKDHFGLARDDREGLLQALNIDFRRVAAPYVGPKLHEDIPERNVKVDMWGVHRRWIEHETGGYWDFCDFPLQDATLEDVEKWPMPSPDDFDYSRIEQASKDRSEYAISCGDAGVGDVINSTGMIRGMEQTLVDLMLEEPAGLTYIDRRANVYLEVINRTLEAAKGGIDFLWLGEDLGTQIAPMVSLDLFRAQIAPRHQKFIDLAKSYDIPVMIHTCGCSSWAYDDFAEMGVNVVDTLQPEATDMAPAYLKEKFGDRLAFHGCISTAGPVATGTVEEAVKDAKEIMDIMMPGGGYSFAPTHQFQDNSPTENVVAVYKAAFEYGRYGV